jgi:hypothetical protein
MRSVSQDELRWATAYHESGHAALAAYFERVTTYPILKISLPLDLNTFLGVTLRKVPENKGVVFRRILDGDEDFVRAEVMLNLAGVLAEELSGHPVSIDEFDKSQDRIEIDCFLSFRTPRLHGAERESFINSLREETKELLSESIRWGRIRCLAEELYHFPGCPELSGERVYELLGECWRS